MLFHFSRAETLTCVPMRKIYVQCPTECYLRHVKWKIKMGSLLLWAKKVKWMCEQTMERGEKERSEWINEKRIKEGEMRIDSERKRESERERESNWMKTVDKSQSQIEETLIWRQYYCVVIESNAFVAEAEEYDRPTDRPSDQAHK